MIIDTTAEVEVGLDIMVLQQTSQGVEINFPLVAMTMEIAILFNNRRFNKKMRMMMDMMKIFSKIQNKIETLNILTNITMEVIKITKLRQEKMMNSKIMITRMSQIQYNNGM